MSFAMDLEGVQSAETSAAAVEVLNEQLTTNEASSKEICRDFLMKVCRNLKQPKSPDMAFYTLLLFRNIFDRKEIIPKVFSHLSSHKLYPFLEEQALTIDPRKPIEEKGKKLFPTSPAKGNDYMRLLLQSFQVWGAKFSTNLANQTPTKYRKSLNQLLEDKVTMPKEPKYYGGRMDSKEEPKKPSQTPEMQANKTMHLIKLSRGRIQTLLTVLENCRDNAQIEKEIQDGHSKFVKDSQNFNEKQMELIDNQPENVVEAFFKLNEFLDREKNIYDKNKNNPTKYIVQYIQAYDQVFDEQPQQMNNINKELQKSQKNDIIPNLIQNVLSKLDTKTQEPAGFNFVTNALGRTRQEQTKQLNKSLMKSRSKSPYNNSRISASKTNKSNLFLAPPNPNPPKKEYEGELVQEDEQLRKSIKDLQQNQGNRRMKVANFREKHILYEDEVMQIGFKSQTIYERIGKYEIILNLEVFMGNKTELPISRVKLQWHGDKNSLIYTNPKTIEDYVSSQTQVKINGMLIPLNTKFNPFRMHLDYQYNGVAESIDVILPYTILKLTTFKRMEAGSLNAMWKACCKKLKSKPFKLSKHFPPNTLLSVIKELNEFTEYDEFSRVGSVSDYELFCQVTVKQAFSGVMRLNIRPNMMMVVQVGTSVSGFQAADEFSRLLETLLFVFNEDQ